MRRVDVEGNVNNYIPPAGEIPNNSIQGLFETDYIDDLDISTLLFHPAVVTRLPRSTSPCGRTKWGAPTCKPV